MGDMAVVIPRKSNLPQLLTQGFSSASVGNPSPPLTHHFDSVPGIFGFWSMNCPASFGGCPVQMHELGRACPAYGCLLARSSVYIFSSTSSSALHPPPNLSTPLICYCPISWSFGFLWADTCLVHLLWFWLGFGEEAKENTYPQSVISPNSAMFPFFLLIEIPAIMPHYAQKQALVPVCIVYLKKWIMLYIIDIYIHTHKCIQIYIHISLSIYLYISINRKSESFLQIPSR